MGRLPRLNCFDMIRTKLLYQSVVSGADTSEIPQSRTQRHQKVVDYPSGALF